MPENTVVSISPDSNYWDGAYSRCHVGNAIESYVRESIRRLGVPITVILSKSDGFISRRYYDQTQTGELNQHVTPSETVFLRLEALRMPATYPIVAALCSRGVERSNMLYLPLDDNTFVDGLEEVLRPIPSPAWEDRKPIVYWRGGSSGCGLERPSLRVRVASALYGHPGTDVRITPWGNWENEHDIPPYLFAPRCGLEEHFQAKYILIVDGNLIASNHQWVFGSGAVPIMITHPDNEYWFKQFLEPMVNYVPIKYDLSDLKPTLDWLRTHDAEAKAIAENALAFSRRVFSPQFQRAYLDDTIASIAIGPRSELYRGYVSKCLIPSDINEHLETLHAYARKCTSVVECGVANVVSSYALASALLGKPGHTYTMIDPRKSHAVDPFLALCAREGINATFIHGSDIACEPSETDMLFIDTWHVYAQLTREFAHWHAHVRKYILLHDTTVDEIHGESIRARLDTAAQSRETGYPEEEIRKGLGPAITEFLAAHPEWIMVKKYTHNNGLTVLARR
jgi:hypothetical protein